MGQPNTKENDSNLREEGRRESRQYNLTPARPLHFFPRQEEEKGMDEPSSSAQESCPVDLSEKPWFELYTNLVSTSGHLCDPSQACCNRVGNDFRVISNYLDFHVAVLKSLLPIHSEMKAILEEEIAIATTTARIDRELSDIIKPVRGSLDRLKEHRAKIKELNQLLDDPELTMARWNDLSRRLKKLNAATPAIEANVGHAPNKKTEQQYKIDKKRYVSKLKRQITAEGICFPAGWDGIEQGHAIYLWISLDHRNNDYRVVAFNLGAGIEKLNVGAGSEFCFPAYFDVPSEDIDSYLNGVIRANFWGDTPGMSYSEALDAIYGRDLGLTSKPLNYGMGQNLQERIQFEGNCIVKNYLHGLRFRLGDSQYKKLYLAMLNAIFAHILEEKDVDMQEVMESHPVEAIMRSEAVFRHPASRIEIERGLPALMSVPEPQLLDSDEEIYGRTMSFS